MLVRLAQAADAGEIAAIYYNTIRRVNAADYSRQQIEAWAPELPRAEDWRQRMSSYTTVVADDGGTIAGFAELEEDGHIDCFYCHHDYQRRGVGSLVLAEVEKAARSRGIERLYLESSATARPFFEARGFVSLGRRDIVVRGVELENYAMEKHLHEAEMTVISRAIENRRNER